MENYEEYYDVIKQNIESCNNEYDEFIKYGPDIFRLLTDILNVKKLDPIIRLKVSAALGYFVAPYDIIPEKVYGALGYIDDIYISAYVLKDIENELGLGYLESIWEGNNNLKEVVDECYENSSEILGDKVKDIIKYTGLDYFENDITNNND